jgi:hypothetical protein
MHDEAQVRQDQLLGGGEVVVEAQAPGQILFFVETSASGSR